MTGQINDLRNDIRKDFTFNGTPTTTGVIITNVPVDGWCPIASYAQSRSGWVYDFVRNENVSRTYWCVKIPDATTTSGSFSGSIIAIKI